MKAIVNTHYGGPEVTSITTLPDPVPAEGEVLVRVAAGALNPVDLRIRKGDFKSFMHRDFPFVAGSELSGEVIALGTGVTSFSIGDKVIARVGDGADQTGALAELVTLPASFCARAPSGVPLVDAAGLPLAGLTAEQVLDALGVKSGDRVLITAGAGGVGLFAIQLAKLRGAHVTTTASSAGDSLVRSAGADDVIDYKTTKLSEVAAKFDKIFDCAGGDTAAILDLVGVAAPDGKIISISGTPTPSMLSALDLPSWKHYLFAGALWLQSRTVRNAATAKNVTYDFMFMHIDGKQLQQLSDYVAAGKLHLHIDSHFKFASYKEAFARQESKRAKGKIIVEM